MGKDDEFEDVSLGNEQKSEKNFKGDIADALFVEEKENLSKEQERLKQIVKEMKESYTKDNKGEPGTTYENLNKHLINMSDKLSGKIDNATSEKEAQKIAAQGFKNMTTMVKEASKNDGIDPSKGKKIYNLIKSAAQVAITLGTNEKAKTKFEAAKFSLKNDMVGMKKEGKLSDYNKSLKSSINKSQPKERGR